MALFLFDLLLVPAQVWWLWRHRKHCKAAAETSKKHQNYLLLHLLHLLIVFLWGMAIATATATDSWLQARSYAVGFQKVIIRHITNLCTMYWIALTSHKRLNLTSIANNICHCPLSLCLSLSLFLSLSVSLSLSLFNSCNQSANKALQGKI